MKHGDYLQNVQIAAALGLSLKAYWRLVDERLEAERRTCGSNVIGSTPNESQVNRPGPDQNAAAPAA